ncbi:MAG: hypothetical protein GY788_01435 [bacterium]|nr:hypothetical protein [bacterium]
MHSTAELLGGRFQPDAPLPPRAMVVAQTWSDGPAIRHPPGFDNELSMPLPEEWAVRDLLPLDLDNPEVVLETIDRRGVLGPELPELRLPGLGLPTTRLEDGVLATDAANYLRVGRALVNHVVSAQEGTDPTDAWSGEGFKVTDDMTAADCFRRCLNVGVRIYAPRFEQVTYPGSSISPVAMRPASGLFEGIALQVFNIIQADLQIRLCANETCERRFIRQEGRSKVRQATATNVRYCTSRCAKTQTQRAYRRRKRRADNADAGGSRPTD